MTLSAWLFTLVRICVTLLAVYLASDSLAAPPYPEPTEQEMRQAIERVILERGLSRTGTGEYSVDTSINGVTMTIDSFEKLGCQLPKEGAGYICSYFARVGLSAHSNEGTQAGDRHANATNQILRGMMAGRGSVGETATRRFLRTADGWRLSMQ